MKKISSFILILLICSVAFAQVNGELTQQNGKYILKVWGTHYQRGFAHGYYLAQPIREIFDDYIYPIVAMSNPAVYNSLLSFYQNQFDIEQKYTSEAQGIINGMLQAGQNIYTEGLGRNLMAEDLLLFNALIDINYYRSELTGARMLNLGCASLSSWGTSTEQDTVLVGHSLITRFMDWDINSALLANPLLLASIPSEEGEQPWVSFTYPGLIGALSAISVSGKAAFLNMGNAHYYSFIHDLHPVLLSIRNGIESADYNDDGADNLADVFDALTARRALSGTITHVLSEAGGIQAGIVEKNNIMGTVLRTTAQNYVLPGMHLAATNHFRLLYASVCCSRYANITDSLITNQQMTTRRQLTVMIGAAASDNNLMTIQYCPLDGSIRWSTAILGSPAYNQPLQDYLLDELLQPVTPLSEEILPPLPHALTIYPNPLISGKLLTVKSSLPFSDNLNIYNIKGQKVTDIKLNNGSGHWNGTNSKGQSLPPGIYFIRAGAESGLVKTAKILITR